MLMVHPSTNNSNFRFGRHPPLMHGLPPSMMSFSQSLGVYFPMQFTAWTMESMLKRLQTYRGFVPPSLAPRPGTFSKHLNSHSHSLFNSFRYLPEHFFARLSLGLTHSLQSLRFYTHFRTYTFFLYLLSCTYRLVQVLDSTSGECYSPFYLEIL